MLNILERAKFVQKMNELNLGKPQGFIIHDNRKIKAINNKSLERKIINEPLGYCFTIRLKDKKFLSFSITKKDVVLSFQSLTRVRMARETFFENIDKIFEVIQTTHNGVSSVDIYRELVKILKNKCLLTEKKGEF